MDGSENGHRPFYGDAFNDYTYEVRLLERGTDLSREEKQIIEGLASSGDIESRQRLIQMYLPYVMSIARKYFFPGRLANMDPLDLIQEGNCGLMQAAITFRSERGVGFISYAHSRIEGQIKDAIRKVIGGKGAPRRIQTLHKRITETTMALYEVYRRLPTTEEIANHLQVHEEEVVEATQVMALLTRGQYSLDAVIERGNESRSIDEIIEDLNATDPLESAVRREQQKEIRQVMNEVLTPRERFLLALYYNLTDERKKWAWHELGRQIGVSESRAVQIAHRALAKLGRHPKVAAWYLKLPKLDPSVQTSLTVFEMERRDENKERRLIFNSLRERTILFDEIRGQGHWS